MATLEKMREENAALAIKGRKSGWKKRPPGSQDAILTVYFGRDRIARVRERAEATGLGLSGFVSAAVDTYPELDERTRNKLEALAVLRGVSVAALVGGLIRDAVKSA